VQLCRIEDQNMLFDLPVCANDAETGAGACLWPVHFGSSSVTSSHRELISGTRRMAQPNCYAAPAHGSWEQSVIVNHFGEQLDLLVHFRPHDQWENEPKNGEH
jgi:hypothetical protein